MGHRFATAIPQCAGEFLAVLVGELEVVAGFLVDHREVGVCQGCGAQYDQVVSLSISMPCLIVIHSV